MCVVKRLSFFKIEGGSMIAIAVRSMGDTKRVPLIKTDFSLMRGIEEALFMNIDYSSARMIGGWWLGKIVSTLMSAIRMLSIVNIGRTPQTAIEARRPGVTNK